MKSNMNIFIDKTWQQKHFKDIKQKAGKRYTPHLNVDLPISEIFEGISRTPKFYNEIQKHYGNLKREFRYISKLNDNKKFQNLYKRIKKGLDNIFEILAKIKEYDTTTIPWDKLSKEGQRVEKLVLDLITKLKNQRSKLKEKNKKDSLKEKIERNIHYLFNLQKELDYLIKLALSTKGKLSNKPFLLLTGEAGIGKTHLLCDLVENRIKNNLPAVLVFGEFFKNGIDVWQQIITQLNLASYINSKEEFLKLLDQAGSISKCRSLLIIDALNEANPLSFWRKNLKEVVQQIKNYKNIALIISVRSGFEEEVFTEEVKKEFIEEKHTGFSFKEWEAVTKFFKEFSLPLPEVLLLTSEFQNPLFLMLFCKAFQKRKNKHKQIFRGQEGFTYIFENFVDNVAKEIEDKFNISHSSKKNIWDSIIEKIAEEMINLNTDRITQEKLFKIIKSAYPEINVDGFIKELDRNLLLVKVPRYSKDFRKIQGYDYKFPFNKFSDHLIVRYLLKKCKSENKKPEEYFEENTQIANILKWNYGLLEALSIQCPEWFSGKEIFEIAPYLKNSYHIYDAFIESIIWRKPTAFSKRTINKISSFLEKHVLDSVLKENEKNEDYFIYPKFTYKLLDSLLSITLVPDHPLNAEFLHQHLKKFSMPERDAWWSIFLHFQHEKDSVERIIEWAWSDYDKSHVNDNYILLLSTTLAWFLTTPNRFIRDKATKALVSLLQNRLHLLLKLLDKFKDVNDLYVLERLFAVAYACVLRNQEDLKNIKEIAKWTYDNIFKNGKPPAHILLRDYARGIIEVALRIGINIHIDRNKINPPYKSNWPKLIPSDNEIKRYEFDYNSKDFKKYFWSQNSIIYSMQPEHSTIGMYGDFGRYEFQSALQRWDTGEISIQKLSNLAVKMIFEDLKYNVELHGRFDRYLNYYFNRGREPHKPERIGKKYQWIAFHKILALVSDKFPLKQDFWDKEYKKYIGPWEPYVRDIDPTFIIRNDEHLKRSLINQWKAKIQNYNAWSIEKSTLKWLKTEKDLPNPKHIIQIKDDNNQEWLMLEGFIKWEEETPPEYEKYEIPIRELWYLVKSYIMKKGDLNKIFEWSKKQNFWGRWMPESQDFYEVFLGEYPNSIAFESLRNNNIWINEIWGENRSLPCPVIVTYDSYLNEFIYDCSYDRAVSIKLPCKWLVNKLKIRQKYVDGRWFNESDELVCLPTKIFEEQFFSALLIKKNFLCEFLKENDYEIFWTLLGEKRLIGIRYGNQGYQGHLVINGVYKLNKNKNNNLAGNFTIIKFEK